MRGPMTVEAIILAGGVGKRMGLPMPKPLLDLCGKPLVQHVLEAAAEVADAVRIVHGPGTEADFAFLKDAVGISCSFHLQAEPNGTADALGCALPHIADETIVLALCADAPLLEPDTLRQLLAAHAGEGLALLTTRAPGSRLGRILRDADGQVAAIREYADGSEAERQLEECNTGVMAAAAADFRTWCGRLDAGNAQQELYLTDCVAEAVRDGVPVRTQECAPAEGLGVNTPQEYADVAQHWQRRACARLLEQGVWIEAPETVRLSVGLEAEADAGVRIGSHVVLEGTVRLGAGAQVRSHAVLRDCEIGAGTCIESFTVIERARIGERCRIGPFARIRPETELAAEAQVGNFVEVKKSAVGEGTKINHLSYIGDSRIGRNVNIGAGTITCNYDGAHKHPTVIGDDVFVGSGTQLVAPVTIGSGATIGAGSTITKDAPAGELSLSRKKQKTRKGWRRPRKD